jgi:hypothetical protein
VQLTVENPIIGEMMVRRIPLERCIQVQICGAVSQA